MMINKKMTTKNHMKCECRWQFIWIAWIFSSFLLFALFYYSLLFCLVVVGMCLWVYKYVSLSMNFAGNILTKRHKKLCKRHIIKKKHTHTSSEIVCVYVEQELDIVGARLRWHCHQKNSMTKRISKKWGAKQSKAKRFEREKKIC